METQGLEPWTPALQRRCSSQLSYVPKDVKIPSYSTLKRVDRQGSKWYTEMNNKYVAKKATIIVHFLLYSNLFHWYYYLA